MRLGSYNVENLFRRAVAMNGSTLAAGKVALEAHAAVNALLAKTAYSASDKTKIGTLLDALGLGKSDDGGPFALLRQNRGHLLRRPKNKPLEITANGRDEWIGSVELKVESVNEVATRATGQVIRDVGADVLAVIEAESRPALMSFSDTILKAAGGGPYGHVMLIDGNDDRGIDVGVMAKTPYAITRMLSHVDDADGSGRIFSRDCPEYEIVTPKGNQLVLLVNHLKSKANGGAAATARRKRQAERVRDIYKDMVAAGNNYVAVLGDFNDTPDSAAMDPLVKQTDLKDVSEHPKFVGDGRPGTYGNGTKGDKIDYVLLSPALFAKVTGGGVERRGVWGGVDGKLFPHYPEITAAGQGASDHAAIWADLDV